MVINVNAEQYIASNMKKSRLLSIAITKIIGELVFYTGFSAGCTEYQFS
jgi:hypothetical protein